MVLYQYSEWRACLCFLKQWKMLKRKTIWKLSLSAPFGGNLSYGRTMWAPCCGYLNHELKNFRKHIQEKHPGFLVDDFSLLLYTLHNQSLSGLELVYSCLILLACLAWIF